MLTHSPRQAHVWLIFDDRQKMSTSAIAFGIYLGVGVLLLVLVLATRTKEKGLAGFESGGGGDVIDAWLLIFITVLWPVWLLAWLLKKGSIPPSKP